MCPMWIPNLGLFLYISQIKLSPFHFGSFMIYATKWIYINNEPTVRVPDHAQSFSFYMEKKSPYKIKIEYINKICTLQSNTLLKKSYMYNQNVYAIKKSRVSRCCFITENDILYYPWLTYIYISSVSTLINLSNIYALVYFPIPGKCLRFRIGFSSPSFLCLSTCSNGLGVFFNT